ncbi:transposase [Cricetibacter osteomyelitidis]|uniref:Transposase n=1 Tax=Cricetibacter osteomyelitidis TaxID=1521931 RepID=A0A4R2T857_9PAST|nr:transposase [Cricetibacter osteomyelitidis]
MSESQTIAVLKEAKAGMMVKDVCRKYGISSATYYKFQKKRSKLTALFI